MAAERQVSCPECQTLRTTKANPGVGLACLSCGARFLVPPRDAAPAPAASDAPAPGGVKVTRGRPVVKQTARPRPRAGEAAPRGEGDGAATDGDDDASTAATLEDQRQPSGAPSTTPAGRDGRTGDLDTLTKAGRRGGLARYAKERSRG